MSYAVLLMNTATLQCFESLDRVVVESLKFGVSSFDSGGLFCDRWLTEGKTVGFRIYTDTPLNAEQIVFWQRLCQTWYGRFDESTAVVDIFFSSTTESAVLDVTQELVDATLSCGNDSKAGIALYLLKGL
jgi:hypothetical protein